MMTVMDITITTKARNNVLVHSITPQIKSEPCINNTRKKTKSTNLVQSIFVVGGFTTSPDEFSRCSWVLPSVHCYGPTLQNTLLHRIPTYAHHSLTVKD